MHPVERRHESRSSKPGAAADQGTASATTAETGPLRAGRAAHPVQLPCGVVLGSGTVWPEFGLELEPDAPDYAGQCVRQAERLLAAIGGSAAGAVFDLDFTTAGPRTAWQNVLTGVRRTLDRASQQTGFAGALRVTLNSSEDRIRQAIDSGADIVNLETTAGLELFRRALRASDVTGLIVAAGVLSAPAVSEVWSRSEPQFKDSSAVRGGDSARPFIREIIHCLQLGEAQEVMCAIAVAVCAVPTLASLEAGATGPLRSGSCESLIVKAIRGCPVSLSDASPWEAQAAGAADLWNSSAGVEQTLAECALLSGGRSIPLRAAAPCGPLAHILSEASILAIAEAIQTCQQPYQRAIAAA